MALRTDIEIYSGELKQIFQREKHTDILGIRYQSGDIAAESTLDNVVPAGIAPFFNLPVNSALDRNFERFSLYAYHHWDLRENLVLSGGVAYDRLEWPENYRRPPLSSGGRTRDLVSPKAALIWNPSRQVTLRGAYARSLGGVSAESDLRLEPTQLAGFSQSFRTLISETTLGSVEAPLFDMAGGALDLQFKTGTYMTFEGQWKQSLVDRDFGYFNYDAFRLPPPAIPAQSLERLDYREIAAKYLLNQRLADCFFFEAGYQFTHSALERELVDIPATPTYDRHNLSRSDLHELHGALLFIHNTGLFARAETRWFHQDNDAGMPDSDFPMLNFYAGYRFRHRAELTLGLLNATDREYQLQSLNYYQEMPRERTFYLRLKINF